MNRRGGRPAALRCQQSTARLAGARLGQSPFQAGERAHVAKILIVDDEVDSTDLLSLFLGRQGHEVSVASKGRQAIELGRQWQPDVLLVDFFLLDDVHGVEVARALREDNPELDVIVVSGMPAEDIRARAGDLEFHVMLKPLDLPHLVSRLQPG